jgi:hypothetical protein
MMTRRSQAFLRAAVPGTTRRNSQFRLVRRVAVITDELLAEELEDGTLSG